MNIVRLLQGTRRSPVNLDAGLPEIIWVSEMLFDRTAALLQSFHNGLQEHEGIVYWAGVEAPGQWWLLSCVLPDAETTWGSYMTGAIANSQAILAARRFNLHILAQVHSHPGRWVDHSQGDHQGAFMPFEGFLSVVVPEYAARGMVPLTRCGVHRFERGSFRRLSEKELDHLFRIIPLESRLDE